MLKLIVRMTVLSCAMLAFVNPSLASEASELKIIASIKPVQLITKSLLGDSAEVDVLIPPTSSPHHYSLKPSDVRRLQENDLVLWVGPDLEQFLVKPIKRIEERSLQLLDMEAEESAANDHHDEHDDHARHEDEHHDDHDKHGDEHHDGHDEHAKHEDEHHDDHDEHEEAGHDEHHHDHANDPHLWMAPEHIVEAAELITARLQQDYPARADLFAEKLRNFKTRMQATDIQLNELLKPVQGKGFYVFHDAFSSYVEHYGLNQLGYFTVDPGRKPGAKRLNKIRNALEASKAHCVFVEPQFEAPVVRAIVGDLPINKGTLDPLAINIAADQDGIFNFLSELGSNLANCLNK